MERRPIATRGKTWAKDFARFLAGKNITPNQISLMSIFFSAVAALFFYFSATVSPFFFLFAAIFIQLRLLCNLFDGMVAVEHGKKSKSGDVYNDAPDRFSDLFIIVGAGLAISSFSFSWTLAWFAGSMAVMTAYVRLLGTSLSGENYYCGPMAKQHRMFAITLGALIEFLNFFISLFPQGWAIYMALIVVALGSTYTVFKRLKLIVSKLEEKRD